MKTTQHTPGPWFTLDTGLDVFAEYPQPDKDYLPRRHHVAAAVTTCQFDQEARANAALIAAAPELLAALEKSLVRLESYCCLLQNDTIERRSEGLPQSVEVEFCCQQISANRAAIAKATGNA
jgi:type II secretory pathway component PulL